MHSTEILEKYILYDALTIQRPTHAINDLLLDQMGHGIIKACLNNKYK